MNCIVVDDEFPAREELKYFINNFSSIEILDEFDDSVKALTFVEKNKPDIVFLDINMPAIDGMTFGKIISNLDKGIYIVFITAYKEHAIEAFEVKAFDYILKPYSEERIVGTLKRLEQTDDTRYKSDKITLWKDNKMCVINIYDICYCEVYDRNTLIYTKEHRYSINCNISEFYKKLPENHFFRSHRSFIINLDKIREITPWFNNTYMIKLEGIDDEIPVSRSNINKFKQIMGI